MERLAGEDRLPKRSLRWIGQRVKWTTKNFNGENITREGIITMVHKGCPYPDSHVTQFKFGDIDCAGPTVTVIMMDGDKEKAHLCGARHMKRTKDGLIIKPGVE